MKKRANILIIRLRSIGDIVLTLPAVHAVREHYPDARITYLTRSSNSALLEGFKEVDEILTLDQKAITDPLRALPELFRLIYRLRAGRFSLVVDLQGYGETAWFSWLTGAPKRWGSIYSRGRKWAYTQSIPRNTNLHPIERDLLLLRTCGIRMSEPENQFSIPEDAINQAKALFEKTQLDPEKPSLYIQPFTSNERKNWPFMNYIAVAEYWRDQGIQVLFGGGPNDAPNLELARERGFPAFSNTPLLVSAGLMHLSSLIIGGDTGMIHLAMAQNKRVLMLINGCSPGQANLYQHNEWVIQANDPESFKQLPVETVNVKCRELIFSAA
ncbi:glycosyltransferase family 9 protein [Pontiella agarivorans]|uniref:Glycosyltransferase family 9 protein n=1 Tax=Pontiella agarivorans TaxID=3038953 RepID=A0ABU5N187_9BACT|nr:glycosyltransferase family 9 protein [Pontiella agarivorans]MDZ8120168.1 glycosyltransferase family 9 protein [Pontiella agarivorans]